MAATKPDSMELEAMRKDDCSWHPCRISLSSSDSNVGITVDFETDDEEDVIYNKEDALSHLRFRSIPLHGDECTNIKEGEHVLALQKTQSKSLFIDAAIEEPKRMKHSKRVHCRCTFEIKWLNSELKGEIVTVPSKSILKLSDRRIDDHPIFSSFLNALNSEKGRETPSVLSFSEESTCEEEFIGILEKQVEEISKLVDGSKTSFMDLFLEVKSGTTNVVKPKSKTRRGASQRTTRSRNINLPETQVKTETEVKPVLNPLAARAALASLVHELPEKSFCVSGEQDFIKRRDSQQSDATGTTDLSATSNSEKSNLFLHHRVLLGPNPRKRTSNYTNVDMSAIREKKNNPSREGEVTSLDMKKESPTKKRHTRSMQKEVDVTSDNNDIKRKKLVSTSKTDSIAQRNEPATKRRARLSREDNLGGGSMKDKESPPEAKKSLVSSQKDFTKPPLRSSPRLTCPPPRDKS